MGNTKTGFLADIGSYIALVASLGSNEPVHYTGGHQRIYQEIAST